MVVLAEESQLVEPELVLVTVQERLSSLLS
jgi:hypothetical protein